MFTEELRLIKEAEERADQMRRDAKLSAKKLTEETDAKANRLVDEAFAVEKAKCQALIEEGQKIAQEEYDKAMARAKEACDDMAEQAMKKQSEAINFIAERIVESSVNR